MVRRQSSHGDVEYMVAGVSLVSTEWCQVNLHWN